MARPIKSSSKRTSFGKRSDAEKSFKSRKKDKGTGRYEQKDKFSSPRSSGSSEGPFRGSSGPRKKFGKGFNSRNEDKPFAKSKFEKREGEHTGPKRPYARIPDASFGENKSFKRDGFSAGKRPFTRREDGDSEKPKRFSKRSFDKDAGGARPKLFAKRPFDEKEGEPGFVKRENTRDERPKRFVKKPFDRGEERPSFSKEGEASDKPRKIIKSAFDNKESERPFNKFESKYGAAKKLSRDEVVKRPVGEKRKSFVESRIEKQKEEMPVYVEKPKNEGDLIRLNKYMANSGVGSRRQADELIKMGLVTVNGETITEMGHKVKITDDVRYEGKRLKAEKPVYILLNKPKGFITTTDDPQERNTVMGLVAGAGKERIYPVGRLDRNTTGLLLLTNDGDLADKLTHPSYNAKKIYKVELDRPITKNDFQKIKDGIHMEEGKAMVDDLAIVSDDNKTVGIELHIGWNRIVRRIFESLDYQVVKLDRVVYAGLDKKDLNRGEWRFLRPDEVIQLKHFGVGK